MIWRVAKDLFSQVLYCRGYSSEEPPLPIPNREVKLTHADGTDLLIKAGAKEENIECAAHGASIQLFDGAEKNRVVTIEVK